MDFDAKDEQAWFLKSSCPVELPIIDALTQPRAEFESFIANKIGRRNDATDAGSLAQIDAANEDAFTLVSDSASAELRKQTDKMRPEEDDFSLISASTSAEIRRDTDKMRLEDADDTKTEGNVKSEADAPGQPFMQALLTHQDKKQRPNMENKMYTENNGVAYRSTTNALVDLFSELDEVISGPRLRDLLEPAWNEDPLITLKLIFNSRSIHLGQSSRYLFYRCAGWLAQNHPLTLVTNLPWLCRPVVEKKAKKQNEDGNLVVVEAEEQKDDDAKHDVKYGVAHGYWKDLLNMLALAVNNKFGPLADPRDILTSENSWSRVRRDGDGGSRSSRRPQSARGGSQWRGRTRASMRTRGYGRGRGRGRGRGGGPFYGETSEEKLARHEKAKLEMQKEEQERLKLFMEPALAKEARHAIRERRHKAALEALESDPVYLSLHVAIARLFAKQLQLDLKALRGTDNKAKRNISLCGKWAPSHDHFHDRHTFVVSSIAEILHPRESFDHVLSPSDSRETYLRYAREEYRKDISALRKHLEVVERDITAGTFDHIKYNRVPSVAMKNYVPLFIEQDFKRFEDYIENVAAGKAKISGATLLPSVLMHAVAELGRNTREATQTQLKFLKPEQLVERKVAWIKAQAVDGQWRTLVQRIKDSGTLSSSIAVCDVSGSMSSPRFPDGTCPMDSAIGLSLLVAEVTEPPFGGAFITFSASPKVVEVDLSKPLAEKYKNIRNAPWGMNTNFIAVFENLLLPMAVTNEIKPEDMVKRVFVFSDMQFDDAQKAYDNFGTFWDKTAYDYISKKYSDAGYEMPELVFWNLAGGRAGYGSYDSGGDATAPKPVTAAVEGTSLVSGYSQAMLKVFLENGSFEEESDNEDEDAKVETKEGEDGQTVVVKKRKAGQMDPVTTMKKAIGHKGYNMLRVMD